MDRADLADFAAAVPVALITGTIFVLVALLVLP
jgi:hypothetical protein